MKKANYKRKQRFNKDKNQCQKMYRGRIKYFMLLGRFFKNNPPINKQSGNSI